MRTIYIICVEDVGEVEGAFDDKGELLDTWCNNDATWRHEYFEGFMNELGITVGDPPEELLEKMEQKLRDFWGDDHSVDEEDEEFEAEDDE